MANASPRVGFTLLELLIVLAIVGLIATLVVPRIGSGPDALLDVEANRLASALALAAKEARLTGHTIVWRADGSAYAFTRSSDDGASPRHFASDLKPRTLPEGVAITALRVADARPRGEWRLAFASAAPIELFSIEMRAGPLRYAVASTATGEVRASRASEAAGASR